MFTVQGATREEHEEGKGGEEDEDDEEEEEEYPIEWDRASLRGGIRPSVAEAMHQSQHSRNNNEPR